MIEKKKENEDIFFCPGGTPSSKNSRQWTGSRFLPSKATTTWRNETQEWWKNNKSKFEDKLIGLEKPYLIGIHFVRKSKHKFDWINPCQTVQDEMTKYGYIDDDNCDEMIPFPLSIDGEWQSYNKSNPGAYIKILSANDALELHKILNIKKEWKS